MVKRTVADAANARAVIVERCEGIVKGSRPEGWSVSAAHRAAYKRHMDRFRFIMRKVNICPSDELLI